MPYYVLFSRYTDEVQYFRLAGCQYHEAQATQQGLWLPEAGIGLGVWLEIYHGLERHWLRFYDAQGRWILTPVEQEQQALEQERQRVDQERQRANQEQERAEHERQRAEHEQQHAARLAARLRALGVEPTL